MTTAWDFGGAPAATGDVVTLVEGDCFCISDHAGRMDDRLAHGLFHLDTRIVSAWHLTLDNEEIEPLAAFTRTPHHVTFLGRAQPRAQGLESTLVIRRERYIGAGMREDIVVRNEASEPAAITLHVTVASDFADLFAVKEGRVRHHNTSLVNAANGLLELQCAVPEVDRGIRVKAEAASVEHGRLVFRTVVEPRTEWSTSIQVSAVVGGSEVDTHFTVDEPIERAAPSRRLHDWAQNAPAVSGSNNDLLMTLARSREDLGSLRIFDPEHPGQAAVAAGAPWFMALFGRDSLLTAYMALPLDQQLALGTLKTLARHQGREENPITEEQPGRILHEMRFGSETLLALGGGHAYYGTVDATPLFVMVLGALMDWGVDSEQVQVLVPAADRALAWIDAFGDRDGDGFVEYQRLTDRGLRNQGWKDSWDGINFADGRIAEPPLALCEVQGYVYAAFCARARIAKAMGDTETQVRCETRADDIKRAFNEKFWIPERGWFAVALDRDKRQVDALTSNMGHCLWTGIVDAEKAPLVARHLLSDEMFSGWGLRTLAASMAAYNPISYHNGSVWPHDTTLAVAGLMRYGFVAAAQKLAQGVLDAAACFGGRLPELFSGLDRRAFPSPVNYPSSCSPQAWASASPIHLVRTLVNFEPDASDKRVFLAPAWPDGLGELSVRGPVMGAREVSLRVRGNSAELTGLPDGVDLVHSRRYST